MAIEYLLQHNFFMFDCGYYLQVTGASMGAKFSPSIANIYMAWWEQKHLFHVDHPMVSHIRWYGRYIDDLLFILELDMAAVPAFSEFLNSNNLGLRFSVQGETDIIPFLDLNLEGINGRIKTSTFRKNTAGNNILHAESCHPRHVVNNIPTGELIRARRNCSQPAAFEKESKRIINRLLCRKYPAWTLKRASNIADKKDREVLLKYNKKPSTPKKVDSPLVFSTTYSMEYDRICTIVKKHLPLIHLDPDLSNTLSAGFRCVARRAPTLSQSLSPSLFLSKPTNTPTWLQHTGF